jgi:hypothetical protein
MMLLKIIVATVAGLYLLDHFYGLLMRGKALIEARFPDDRHENDQR